MESLNGTRLAWGVACLPHPKADVLGDGYVVKPIPNGLMLAVADGLGHGSEAAIASALCIDTLAMNAELPIPAMLRLCHERLRGTRGATMSVASFDCTSDELTWSGVGDVAAVLIRADTATPPGIESLVLRAGLLGSGSPALTAARTRIGRGDLVVLATDGIGPGFERSVDRSGAPQAIAERILADHAKRTDDALVLVARYTGGRA
jgi:phosphoserine phosphatase RsbX